MPRESSSIIADGPDHADARRAARVVFALSAVLGAAAAWYYAKAGLTLSHYDARAHLVVARRVLDSLTPGWRQLGAVWLPLPHLLNLLPVQWDWSFRTGFSGVVFSIVTLSAGLSALCRHLLRQVDSPAVAILVPLMVLANPGVLYLQSTPMTEALLFGLSFLSLLTVDTWVARGRPRDAQVAGLLMAALVLTRYEGWLIAAALTVLAWISRPRPRRGWGWLAFWPIAAVVAFVGLSYAASGILFASDDFFDPVNPARGSLIAALRQVGFTTYALAGPAVLIAGLGGVATAVLRARGTRGRSLLMLSLFPVVLLPLAAFYDGHPLRVRYMIPIAVAATASAGLVFSVVPAKTRALAAAALLALAVVLRPPLSPTSPMVVEAQWEVPFSQGRRAVTAFLQEHYDGTPILASMGSLAHYMQEAASIGLCLRDFLHEGNGDLWSDAIASPRMYVRWILIEEQARDGGPLARRASTDPAFLEGFSRVSEGGGLALYERR